MNTFLLLGITVIAILLLLLLVMKFRIHAFISLLLVSVFIGLSTGMGFTQVIESIQSGMGSILGFIAVIIGLGSILGKILEVSGGAEVLALRLIKLFGEKRASWALAFTGFIISIPVFFDVGVIILIPVVYALTRKTGKSVLAYAIPLFAGLAVTHAFIPPTPGPVAVAEIMSVPLGWMIMFGIIIAIPTVFFAGPIFGKYISQKIVVGIPEYMELNKKEVSKGKESDFKWVLLIIILPLFLILISTVIDLLGDSYNLLFNSRLIEFIKFVGHPFIALTLATLLALYFLGFRKGLTGKQLLNFSDKALAPAGLIILVTGAGGVFKQILVESGVGNALAETLIDLNVAPIVLAYLLSVIIRITQGSATVSMITAAGMIAPVVEIMDLSNPQKALVAIAIAAGSTILSHVNDSGFWLVNKYLGLTEKQTLQSWTVMETIISLSGFTFAMLLWFFV